MAIFLTALVALGVGWLLGRGAARLEYRNLIGALIRVNEHNQRDVDRMAEQVHTLIMAQSRDRTEVKWPERL
jgi:alpha-D-ribose 1-methylphosphonate 5-triphosphate synthase subunit PhnG